DIFRRWGHPSEIFVEPARVSPALRGDCRPLADYASDPGDVVLHHYGLASSAADVFAVAEVRKILVYHNITPPEFFRGYDDTLAARLVDARAQIADLAQRCAAVWAVSQFDAADLAILGFPQARVFPLVVTAQPDAATDVALKTRLAAPALTTLLFVGRLAPNKRVEDLLEAYTCYRRLNPYSRLFIVGSERSCPRYSLMLRLLARDLGAANVCFEGFATPTGLAAYYELADVFISCSAHEGYGAPLVEAMRYGVPVIARDAGGTREALGGAGVMYSDATPAELAELINRVTSDQTLHSDILTAQQCRMNDLRVRPVEQELRALLDGFLPKA
ncbi:MAG: glycosyltransferase, partial [Kiritimatiellaeota bacterium]|nr:glycosyltransferase [Kiritimatiellota bacterium]